MAKNCEACDGSGCPIHGELSVWKHHFGDEQSRSAYSTFLDLEIRAEKNGCEQRGEVVEARKEATPADLWKHPIQGTNGQYYDPATGSMKNVDP